MAAVQLKASVSNEGRINVLLWYCLVGAYVGLPLGVVGSPGGKWRSIALMHLTVRRGITNCMVVMFIASWCGCIVCYAGSMAAVWLLQLGSTIHSTNCRVQLYNCGVNSVAVVIATATRQIDWRALGYVHFQVYTYIEQQPRVQPCITHAAIVQRSKTRHALYNTIPHTLATWCQSKCVRN